jgi:hypothetical protein
MIWNSFLISDLLLRTALRYHAKCKHSDSLTDEMVQRREKHEINCDKIEYDEKVQKNHAEGSLDTQKIPGTRKYTKTMNIMFVSKVQARIRNYVSHIRVRS